MKNVTKGTDTINRFAQWKSKFVKVKDKSPRVHGKNWQENPKESSYAIRWISNNYNVGLVTGKASSNLILLDVDGYYENGEFRGKGLKEFLWRYSDIQGTPVVVREGADKGKLVIRMIDQPPRKKVKMTPSSRPYFEILSRGNMGVIAGQHPSGVPYKLLNAHHEPADLSLDQLDKIVQDWAEGNNINSKTTINFEMPAAQVKESEKKRLENLLRRIVDKTNASLDGDGQFVGHCPAHPDYEKSLRFTFDKDRILLICYAGCKFDEITKALGMKQGWLFAHDD
jgi:hypothetical protein